MFFQPSPHARRVCAGLARALRTLVGRATAACRGGGEATQDTGSRVQPSGSNPKSRASCDPDAFARRQPDPGRAVRLQDCKVSTFGRACPTPPGPSAGSMAGSRSGICGRPVCCGRKVALFRNVSVMSAPRSASVGSGEHVYSMVKCEFSVLSHEWPRRTWCALTYFWSKLPKPGGGKFESARNFGHDKYII